jgi:hypothetical protein
LSETPATSSITLSTEGKVHKYCEGEALFFFIYDPFFLMKDLIITHNKKIVIN